jgi:ketosteroid isomerase-like protein
MRRLVTIGVASVLSLTGSAAAAELDANAAHARFIDAFNARDWNALREVVADDVVFHRANAEEVFVGADAVIGVFEKTIGADDQWNVKFARLASDSQLTGRTEESSNAATLL